MRKKDIVFALSMFLLNNAFAQTEDEKKVNLPSIGGGIGILSYIGDIGQADKSSPFSGALFGYSLSIKERVSFMGLTLNVLNGKVYANERSSTRNLNFESPVFDASLNLSFHFDNDFILPKKAVVAPYISAGFGYLKFSPKADLRDKFGNLYYYWSNGDIKDISEKAPNAAKAKPITRDYVYESNLPVSGDSLNSDNIKYNFSSFTIPVTAGVLFKLSPVIHINISAAYYMCQTDWLDNLSSEGTGVRKGDPAKDNFLYSSVGVYFNLGKGNKSKKKGNGGTDFSSLENTDSDQDGVKDVADNCADTPAGTKTDAKGCPLDSDNDGIYDYLDKEPNTKKGEIVDANGVTLKDDVLVTEHEASVRAIPSEKQPEKASTAAATPANPASGMPELYKEVDMDKDGKISTGEINSAIDNFFEGNTKLKIDDIYRLIDYFFEQ